MQMENLAKFHQFVPTILDGKEILTITKGHNHVVFLRTLTRKNPTVDLFLCWGFTAQSTQWGHVERGQFT